MPDLHAAPLSTVTSVMPVIELTTVIRASCQRCFDVSVDVDEHQRSQTGSGERAVAGVTTGRMQLGDEVTWEARHLLCQRRLTSRITEYDPPHRFVDEMVAGDFERFRHEHVFAASPEGTLMTDRFDFTSPYGILGRLADAILLRSYMRKLLATRNAHLKRAAEESA